MSELLSVPSLTVTLRTLSGPMIPLLLFMTCQPVYSPPQNVGETYGCFWPIEYGQDNIVKTLNNYLLIQ